MSILIIVDDVSNAIVYLVHDFTQLEDICKVHIIAESNDNFVDLRVNSSNAGAHADLNGSSNPVLLSIPTSYTHLKALLPLNIFHYFY